MSDTIICPSCGKDRVRIFANSIILAKRMTYTVEPKEWDDNFITRADLWKCGKCGTFFVDGYGMDFEDILEKHLD